MFLLFAAPLVILGLVLAVPVAYRYLWPIKIDRPRLFLAITLAMGLVIAGAAIYWFFSVLMGTGATDASSQTAASNAAFESILRKRLLVATAFAALVEYLLCRITQTVMGVQALDLTPLGDDTLHAVPSLHTLRLRLRPPAESDFNDYASLCADAEVMRYVGDRGPLSHDDAWRQLAMLIGHWALRGFGMWVVEELGSGAFVGRVGLHYPEGWPEREVAWALARPYWGRGYAFEAATAAPRESLRAPRR